MAQTQEEMIAEQKAQCPFCKIVKGEIPTTIIYQDSKVIALADINPSVTGHVLLLPKEHYPILPLVPSDVSQHMFAVVRDISRALKKSMVTMGTNVFIANGGAAGQQSPHFLLHIMPREKKDALSNVFAIKENGDAKAKNGEIIQSLSHNLQLMLSRATLPVPQEKKTIGPSDEQKKSLAAFIENNDEFRTALLSDVSKAKEIIAKNPDLQKITAGIDLQKLHERLKSAYNE